MPLIRPKKRLFEIGLKQIKKFVLKGVKKYPLMAFSQRRCCVIKINK